MAQVVVREIVEAMLFTISSSYSGEFKIDSESDFIISGQTYFRLVHAFPYIFLWDFQKFWILSFYKINRFDIMDKICVFLKKI